MNEQGLALLAILDPLHNAPFCLEYSLQNAMPIRTCLKCDMNSVPAVGFPRFRNDVQERIKKGTCT